jgi:6-phosphogluconolactonase
MIDRRTFTTLLAGSMAAPQLAFGQAKKTVYYASVGAELTLYSMDVDGASLTKVNSVTLPANVQYVWPHPNKQFLYVASSGGGPGVASNTNFSHAFKIEAG